MTSPALLALNICTLTIIGFAVHILLLRSSKRRTDLPLAASLICVGILLCQPSLAAFFPAARVYVLFFSLPALLAIAPCFWLYIKGITSTTPWYPDKKVHRHFSLAWVGMVIAVFACSLPGDIVYPLMESGDDSVVEGAPALLRYPIYAALIVTFVLVLGWVPQAGFYVLKIFRQLAVYRRHLKDVFASTETREARWVNWLLVALGGMWFAAALNIVWDNVFNATVVDQTLMHIAALIVIWSVALWGLRQNPGFEELYGEVKVADVAEQADESEKPKYSRSALDESHSTCLARAIQAAMDEDLLYLDNALSLQKLARHINSTPNYVSQTLNETLKASFFDFINQHRVADAKSRLLASDVSVVDIAMDVGFNAKSSFYTAFRKEVGMTPVQYRKSHSTGT